ncbi:MAG: hypothetical protein ACYTG0_42455 [Planctomycetota bacterium]|jgi:hypothetical protein
MLTRKRPYTERVGKGEVLDVYIVPGDDIGFRNMCPWAAERIWGVALEPLQSVRVWMDGGTLSE